MFSQATHICASPVTVTSPCRYVARHRTYVASGFYRESCVNLASVVDIALKYQSITNRMVSSLFVTLPQVGVTQVGIITHGRIFDGLA